MIVGQTGSGKSTVWKILQSTLSQMKKDGEPGYNLVKVFIHIFALYGLWTVTLRIQDLFQGLLHRCHFLPNGIHLDSFAIWHLKCRFNVFASGIVSFAALENTQLTTVNMLYYLCFFQEFPINPKALSLGELYGEFDLNTNEWTDGVLSSVMRQTCSGWFYYSISFSVISESINISVLE